MILHNQKDKLGNWLPKVEKLYDESGSPRWFEHPVHGSKVDCVALPLMETEGVHFYPYNEYGKSSPVYLSPADSVSVIGFPFGLMGGGACAIWATGFIASEPKMNLNDLPLMLIDCRGRPGQSGSPVLVHKPNGGPIDAGDHFAGALGGPITIALGIYSGRINKHSDLGMVWKMSAVWDIVDFAADQIAG